MSGRRQRRYFASCICIYFSECSGKSYTNRWRFLFNLFIPVIFLQSEHKRVWSRQRRTIENVFVSCIISSLFCSSYFFLTRTHARTHMHAHTHPPAVIETVFLIETKGLRFLCNSFDPYQWCVFHMLCNPHRHHLPHPTDPVYFPSPSHLTLLRTLLCKQTHMYMLHIQRHRHSSGVTLRLLQNASPTQPVTGLICIDSVC